MSSKVCVKPYQGLEAAGGFCLAGAAGIQEDPGGQDMLVLRGSLIVRGRFNKASVFSQRAGAVVSPQTQLANSEARRRGQKPHRLATKAHFMFCASSVFLCERESVCI